MDYEEFLEIVSRQTGLDAEAAQRAIQATLETLARRLSKGESRDLLRQLPAELKPYVYTDKGPEAFDVDEFLRRVAEREQVDVEEAERHARAVFWALGGALDAKEVADLAADLPEEFDPLVAEAQRRHVEVMRSSEFLSRVARRTGLDAEGAERATAAVLETLAERIAAGEVRDLIRELPVRLHPPLRRGIAGRSGTATRMGLEEFLRRVAEREGVSLDQAREHAAAVFATLREAITDKEFFDITVQLPDEYWALLPRP
ncbi:DUF2267 domain-containing protein [Microbispora sp. NBRC 16548]|uniref:DUF2267 domain-containing protein n=1 Tax=Microbispora sp. NBRC 16548 TaxID=3030994 RepID=UPI0024A4DF6E|nr:DUF2267 domain-containing protein [Microbispora sp. NBRC 16548]GLX11004.1 hypothetical protein Misp03_79300 [Microbispora sp. NBRC 16548]